MRSTRDLGRTLIRAPAVHKSSQLERPHRRTLRGTKPDRGSPGGLKTVRLTQDFRVQRANRTEDMPGVPELDHRRVARYVNRFVAGRETQTMQTDVISTTAANVWCISTCIRRTC